MTFHFSTSKCFNVPEWFLKSLNRKSQLVRDMTMSDCKILTCYRRHEKLAMIPKHFDHELADLVGLYTVPLHDQTHCKSSFPMLCAMVYDMEGLRKMMSGLEESENFLWAYNSFQTFDDFGLCSNGDLADAVKKVSLRPMNSEQSDCIRLKTSLGNNCFAIDRSKWILAPGISTHRSTKI